MPHQTKAQNVFKAVVAKVDSCESDRPKRPEVVQTGRKAVGEPVIKVDPTTHVQMTDSYRFRLMETSGAQTGPWVLSTLEDHSFSEGMRDTWIRRYNA